MALIEKIFSGLKKTRENFLNKLDDLFGNYKKIDDEFFNRLEEILIMSDVGAVTSVEIVEKIKKICREKKCSDVGELKNIFVDEIINIFRDHDKEEKFDIKSPTIILVVGVNGAGKTTAIGKL